MNRFQEILNKYWGYDKFRPLQKEIIQSVFDNKDTLGLLPTGGGKSITFQVPALAKDGICIVITPLIALMLDQVHNLKKRNIPAEAIYSGMTQREIELVFDKAAANQIKFLYLSPERLKTDMFQQKARGIPVNLIAVDEAHCISQWGYDFRPAYLEIAQIRDLLPDTPILALTASATPEVVKDIQKQLQFKVENVFSKSFFRDNLVYISRFVEDKLHYLKQILYKIPGSGIVYVRNRKQTYEIAKFLYEQGIYADYYHAGLSQEERKRKQELWQNNQLRVIVSTNAFGMGIDKPDVRFVIHMDLPDSLEAYYQEAGRGGRDGHKAYAGVIYNKEDLIKLKDSINLSFPPIDEIKRTYAALGNYFQIPVGAGLNEDFSIDFAKFVNNYKLNINTTFNAIKLLEREGWIQLIEPIDSPSKIHFLVDNNDLYRFYISNPDFETFIRLLLRSYQGLFSAFVNINEYHLARKANISVKTVRKYFSLLQQNHLLSYIPRKHTSYIVYTQERIDEKYLHISSEIYQNRKQHAINKIDAMINFVSSSDHCRSAIILEYFGEREVKDCGMCDYCVEKKNNQKREKEIQEKLKNLLQKQSLNTEEICKAISTNPPTLLKAIKPLIDENIIRLKQDKSFELVN
jgi:ATP-dependent DNA helicase RecQ